jgi:hypothetical protein
MYILSILFLSSEKIDMEYSLNVKGDSDFQLKIPYPYFPHDQEINDLTINESEHGKVYELRGNNNSIIHINSKKVSFLFYKFSDNYFFLSTNNTVSGSTANLWFFSNENVSISFSVIFNDNNPNSGKRIKIIYSGNITPGWNLLKMAKSIRHSDSFTSVCCFCFSFNIIITVICVLYINRLTKRK